MHTCSYGMTCPKENMAFPTAVLLFWKFAMSLSTSYGNNAKLCCKGLLVCTLVK